MAHELLLIYTGPMAGRELIRENLELMVCARVGLDHSQFALLKRDHSRVFRIMQVGESLLMPFASNTIANDVMYGLSSMYCWSMGRIEGLYNQQAGYFTRFCFIRQDVSHTFLLVLMFGECDRRPCRFRQWTCKWGATTCLAC